jgi:ribonucleoside-diphosphate reductase alpha chain
MSRTLLPDERKSITHHFEMAGMDGYVIVGLYSDGRPGELFIRTAKQGSTISGLLDALGIAVSLGLQYGVPLSHFTRKLQGMKFEPAGLCPGNEDVRVASSVVDYVFHWLEIKFKSGRLGEQG